MKIELYVIQHKARQYDWYDAPRAEFGMDELDWAKEVVDHDRMMYEGRDMEVRLIKRVTLTISEEVVY